jgi:hypothetical protein
VLFRQGVGRCVSWSSSAHPATIPRPLSAGWRSPLQIAGRRRSSASAFDAAADVLDLVNDSDRSKEEIDVLAPQSDQLAGS